MGKYKPFILLGPGDTIRDELEFYGWDQKDLAEITGYTEKHISQLLNNKVPITIEMARKLSEVFKQSPQFWLNLDNNYRLQLEGEANSEHTAAFALIYRYMPIREMRTKKWIKNTENLVNQVKKFWEISTLSFDFLEKEAEVFFRKSETYQKNFNYYYALTWLKMARNIILKIKNPERFFREKLIELVEQIPEFTLANGGPEAFLNTLRTTGVLFLHLPHLQKTYTDGAVFWFKNNPVIVYTARYDRVDNFWWTMAHEIGHILRHKGKKEFIDSLDYLDLGNQEEKEADEFARRILRANEIKRFFQGMERISRRRVEECAVFLGIHPGIVVGCLQHSNQIGYNTLNEFKHPVRTILEKYK